MDTPANDNSNPWTQLDWQVSLILNRLRCEAQKNDDPRKHQRGTEEQARDDQKRGEIANDATAA